MPICFQHNDPIVTVKVKLAEMPYPVWRRIEIQGVATLENLNEAIQAAFGWWGHHLWRFDVEGGLSYTDPDDEELMDGDESLRGADSISLQDLFSVGVRKLYYTYDFGDGWDHEVTLEKMGPGDTKVPYYPVVTGKGRCPPDDVGGAPGFYRFLEAMEATRHPRKKEMTAWYGGPFLRDDIEHRMILFRLVDLQENLQLPRERWGQNRKQPEPA